MLWWLVLGSGLYYMHVFAPSTAKMGKMGVMKYLGNRSDDPDLTGMGARIERASLNMKENFPVFVALAVASIAMGQGANDAVILGAQIFVLFRLAFLVIYALGIPVLRSVAWTGAFVGLIMMVVALLGVPVTV